MNKAVVSKLLCPNCFCGNLELEEYLFDQDYVNEGRLTCLSCGLWYRIQNGIGDLLPLSLRNNELYSKFAQRYKLPFSISESKKRYSQEVSQMNFFKKNKDKYEEAIVDSNFYKALCEVTFSGWAKRKIKKKDLVLDAGCGTGIQSLVLAKNGIRTIGIDISEEMLLIAKDKADSAGLSSFVDFIMASAERLPFKNDTFDACVLYGVLHHLSNPQNALIDVSKKIKNKGLVYTLDPHKSRLRFIFDFMMKMWRLYEDEPGKNSLISRKQLKEWFLNSGISGNIKISTYLPPHFLYPLTVKMNIFLLKASDALFGHFPLLRKLGGVIITEGIKRTK
ncbi:MAG: methyltransferase domain-containing protein [Candidatus Omnitrophica bacterium]|nr:methyltransferase domain-containing protein [Candidatus Omnitrophota bacterium]MDD5429420.1 methyltransferase domain-containing protein [Candidatus Omnitrophota bacterium]